jgi:hypothetical protein
MEPEKLLASSLTKLSGYPAVTLRVSRSCVLDDEHNFENDCQLNDVVGFAFAAETVGTKVRLRWRKRGIPGPDPEAGETTQLISGTA